MLLLHQANKKEKEFNDELLLIVEGIGFVF